MTREEIDDIVQHIMINDGPDMHIDGHDVITDFIMAFENGTEQEWANKYMEEKYPEL